MNIIIKAIVWAGIVAVTLLGTAMVIYLMLGLLNQYAHFLIWLSHDPLNIIDVLLK